MLTKFAVDVCYPNPCEHGGICSPDEEGTDGRMCDCPEGYYGPTCHIGKPEDSVKILNSLNVRHSSEMSFVK